MSDNLIIVTLLWERDGAVCRRWLVRPTGATTKPADVPLPHSVRLNCSERLVLGQRFADPERSERRKKKDDIVVICAPAEATDTTVLDPVPKMAALINRQSYYVYASREVAEAIAEEHLEQCLDLGIPMYSAYPCGTPTEWAFEVACVGPGAARDASFALAMLREVARKHNAKVALGTSATYYA